MIVVSRVVRRREGGWFPLGVMSVALGRAINQRVRGCLEEEAATGCISTGLLLHHCRCIGRAEAAQNPEANPTAAMYDAVALAGRGCGLVATSSIPAGTVVLQEDPVLVYTTHAARGAVCAACLRLVDAAQVSACACPDCGALVWFASCVALWLCSSFAERRVVGADGGVRWEGAGAVIAGSGE